MEVKKWQISENHMRLKKKGIDIANNREKTLICLADMLQMEKKPKQC